MASSHANLLKLRKVFTREKSELPQDWSYYTNMAAMTSRENALGYYTAAQRYEFYFKQFLQTSAHHIENDCLHKNRKKLAIPSSVSSLLRIWKIRHCGPGCDFVVFQ